MLFFSAGSILLGMYLVANIASTGSLSTMAERMVIHHTLADRRREMLLNFDEVELSIYRYLAGHHSLNIRETLDRLDQIVLEIRSLRAMGLPVEQDQLMEKLHGHITTIHSIVSVIETARTRAEEMRPLYESFFVGRLLFRRINEAIVDISRVTHRRSIQSRHAAGFSPSSWLPLSAFTFSSSSVFGAFFSTDLACFRKNSQEQRMPLLTGPTRTSSPLS